MKKSQIDLSRGDDMRILSREELGILTEGFRNPAVSIYLPTNRTGDTEQDPIRLKNLLREAEGQLIDYGLRAPDARGLFQSVQQLLSDSHFWQHQGDGLAIFLSPELFRYYQLPQSFQELVVVADRFHIKPLLSLFNENGLFYILAISQNQVRLLQCTRYHAREITPVSMPPNIAEALKYDQPEKQHQFHTTGPAGLTISHGHGISKDYDKVSILRYFQQVDRGLNEMLKEEHAPLIIAGVDYLHPIYREANKYNYLLDGGIKGNPEGLSEKALHEQAWPIVQSYFERDRTEALEKYYEAVSKGLATNAIKQAVLAAYDGRVSTLFVATGVQQWGQFNSASRKVSMYKESRPGVEDLLDFAAVQTLIKGGTVYAISPQQVPGETTIAAIFRY